MTTAAYTRRIAQSRFIGRPKKTSPQQRMSAEMPWRWWQEPVPGWPERVTIHNLMRDETTTIKLRMDYA